MGSRSSVTTKLLLSGGCGVRAKASKPGRNVSFVRPMTPQRRDSKPPPVETATARGARRRAKQLPRGSISRLAHHDDDDAIAAQTTDGKRGTYTRAMKQRPRPTARAARGAASRQTTASAPRPRLTYVRRPVKSDASAHHLNVWDRRASSPVVETPSGRPTRPAKRPPSRRRRLQ